MNQLEIMETLCDMCNNNVPIKLKTLINTLFDSDIKPKEAKDMERLDRFNYLDYSGSMQLDLYRPHTLMNSYRITGYISISGNVKLGDNHREVEFYLVHINEYSIDKGYSGKCVFRSVDIENDIVYIAAIEVESIGEIACIDITKAKNSIQESYGFCRELRLNNEERIKQKVTDFLNGDW